MLVGGRVSIKQIYTCYIYIYICSESQLNDELRVRQANLTEQSDSGEAMHLGSAGLRVPGQHLAELPASRWQGFVGHGGWEGEEEGGTQMSPK